MKSFDKKHVGCFRSLHIANQTNIRNINWGQIFNSVKCTKIQEVVLILLSDLYFTFMPYRYKWCFRIQEVAYRSLSDLWHFAPDVKQKS